MQHKTALPEGSLPQYLILFHVVHDKGVFPVLPNLEDRRAVRTDQFACRKGQIPDKFALQVVQSRRYTQRSVGGLKDKPVAEPYFAHILVLPVSLPDFRELVGSDVVIVDCHPNMLSLFQGKLLPVAAILLRLRQLVEGQIPGMMRKIQVPVIDIYRRRGGAVILAVFEDEFAFAVL